MSYCRWSTDDFSCDLYCYEDVSGGYTTHVAGNKPVGEVPKTPPLIEENIEAYAEASRRQYEFLETCERRDITLPHTGETFNDETLEQFRDRLIYLRNIGYRFPDYVLQGVEEEIRDAANG